MEDTLRLEPSARTRTAPPRAKKKAAMPFPGPNLIRICFDITVAHTHTHTHTPNQKSNAKNKGLQHIFTHRGETHPGLPCAEPPYVPANP